MFTRAEQCLIIEETKEKFDTLKKVKNAHVKFAQVILDEQVDTFEELSNPSAPNKKRLIWKEICRKATVACDDNCDITGTETDIADKEYEIDGCRQADSIIVSENKFRHSTLNRIDFVAEELASRLRDLDEYLASQLVAQAYSLAGQTAFEGGYNFNATRNSLEIPSVEMGAGLIPFFAQFVARNEISDGVLIDGGNLYQQLYNMPELAGDFGGLRVETDLFNLVANSDTENSTILLSKGALALQTLAYHMDTPVEYTNGANITKFKVPSPNLPGVEYDVFYQTECAANNDILHKWAVQANYGIFHNPLSGCNPDDTGIYLFDCV